MSRNHVIDDDAQSYLVTVSDLMAGLIFLFLITLMIFVLRYQSATASIQSAEKTRTVLLETLKDSLLSRGLAVEIDTVNGVLRLTEQSINFPSGSSDPLPSDVHWVETLSDVMASVLPCFVIDSPVGCSIEDSIPPDLDAKVDVLMIEGHTDSDTLNADHRLKDNLELSGARAATINRLLVERSPVLGRLLNRAGSRILSISGYGYERLLDPTNPRAAANRRIDLRFIMEPPRPVEALPEPAERVQAGLEDGP